MKLLFCKMCADVRKMDVRSAVTCRCGAVKGRYLPDGRSAIVAGDNAEVLGLDNMELARAVQMKIPERAEYGPKIHAFLFGRASTRVERVGWDDGRFTQ